LRTLSTVTPPGSRTAWPLARWAMKRAADEVMEGGSDAGAGASAAAQKGCVSGSDSGSSAFMPQ
jgi:hypothetical protein